MTVEFSDGLGRKFYSDIVQFAWLAPDKWVLWDSEDNKTIVDGRLKMALESRDGD